MKILAIETSTKVASVALWDENDLIAEFSTNHKMTHSQQLLPMVDNILKSVSYNIEDIDVFAVAEGPGSFTGLRIGITTVKGFAYALNRPVIPVNTLEALAYNISPNSLQVCSILDARNNQVFCGIFKPNVDEYELVGEYMALDILALINILKERNVVTTFVGDAITMHRELIEKELGQLAYFQLSLNTHQRASTVGHLALIKYRKGLKEDSANVLPFYLRKSAAEQAFDVKKEK